MNRLMIRHTMDKPLPYDAEVEYLESTGTQYIDTGIIPDFNFGIYIDFVALSSGSRLFGTSFRNGGHWGGVTISNYPALDGGQMTWLKDGEPYDPGIKQYDNQRISITAISDGTSVNYITDKGYSINLPLVTTSNVYGSFYLYTINTESLVVNASMRIYSCKLYSRNNLIRDYIPVRKGNTGYLYDKISGRLFGNQGTGSFVVGPDYNPFAYQYLTFVPLEDSTFSFSKRGTGNDIEYSIDGGAWTSLASEANTPTVGAGHNIRWRAELTPSTASGSQGIGTFSATGLYDAMGNIMSLLYGDNFVGQTALVGAYTFCNLWREETHIYKADRMVLPAMSLSVACYNIMFYKCTSLVTAPKLPATTLAAYCYQGMFQECTSLTTAPALPATTLANYCYYQMFYKCTGLTTAPELPATILKSQCYRLMFSYCSKLNYIKCLATDISASNCTYYWLSMVSPTGTFVKASGMTGWSTNVSGIPSGWTVVDDPSTISNS